MILIQEMSEVLPIAQLAMLDPATNYRLNLQTAFATNVVDAFAYFDGSVLVESVWTTNDFWMTRGLPRLTIKEEETE